MLSKQNRLSRREISELLKKSKNFRGQLLSVKVFYIEPILEGRKLFKAGVSISKKVAKSAVKRNAMRRAVYKTINDNKNNLKKSSHFLVIIQKAAAIKDLQNETIDLLNKTRLI